MPIIGNLNHFYGHPELWDIFIKWRKEYGDIYTYWFGEQPVVAINDFKTIIETFGKDGSTYEDRPIDKEFMKVIGCKKDNH